MLKNLHLHQREMKRRMASGGGYRSKLNWLEAHRLEPTESLVQIRARVDEEHRIDEENRIRASRLAHGRLPRGYHRDRIRIFIGTYLLTGDLPRPHTVSDEKIAELEHGRLDQRSPERSRETCLVCDRDLGRVRFPVCYTTWLPYTFRFGGRHRFWYYYVEHDVCSRVLAYIFAHYQTQIHRLAHAYEHAEKITNNRTNAYRQGLGGELKYSSEHSDDNDGRRAFKALQRFANLDDSVLMETASPSTPFGTQAAKHVQYVHHVRPSESATHVQYVQYVQCEENTQ